LRRVEKRGIKRNADKNGNNNITPIKKSFIKRARKFIIKKKKNIIEVNKDIDGEFPLNQKIKIKNEIIKV